MYIRPAQRLQPTHLLMLKSVKTASKPAQSNFRTILTPLRYVIENYYIVYDNFCIDFEASQGTPQGKGSYLDTAIESFLLRVAESVCCWRDRLLLLILNIN